MRQPRFAEALIQTAQDPRRVQTPFMLGLAETVDDLLTKRILVDAGLWEALYSTDPTPTADPAHLKWPFPDPTYIESTKPILPARMTRVSPELTQAVSQGGYDPNTEPSYLRAILIVPTGDKERTLCTMATWGNEIVCSTIQLNIESGVTGSHMGTTAYDGSPLPKQFTQEGFAAALDYFGRAATALIVHINNKGIVLEPEPLNRAARRRLDRDSRPNPWYIIRESTPR